MTSEMADAEKLETEPIIVNCAFCGKFMNIEKSYFNFVPDSVEGQEDHYLICGKCNSDK